MRPIMLAVLLASSFTGLAFSAQPLHAQQAVSPSYSFLEAVKKRDGEKVTSLLQVPGNNVVNAQQRDDGRTAMHIVVERRDASWIRFLLAKGANPNIGDDSGDTPLMLATQLSYLEGIETLLTYGAKVNQTNRSGETPLIRAVQLRDTEAVRLLLKSGANADITDNVSGRSARDYAKLDGRSRLILDLLENKPTAQTNQAKGELDFSGIK